MKEEKEEVTEDFDLEKEVELEDPEVEELFLRVVSRRIANLKKDMGFK